MQLPVPQHIAAIVPYPPGKPMDELEREYGVTNAIKLASNENPVIARGGCRHRPDAHRPAPHSTVPVITFSEAVAKWMEL